MSKRKYYFPGIDEFHELTETPASKDKTDFRRFIITTIIACISAVASIVAATVSIMAYLS